MINTLHAYDNAWTSIDQPEKAAPDVEGISKEEILEAVIGSVGMID